MIISVRMADLHFGWLLNFGSVLVSLFLWVFCLVWLAVVSPVRHNMPAFSVRSIISADEDCKMFRCLCAAEPIMHRGDESDCDKGQHRGTAWSSTGPGLCHHYR